MTKTPTSIGKEIREKGFSQDIEPREYTSRAEYFRRHAAKQRLKAKIAKGLPLHDLRKVYKEPPKPPRDLRKTDYKLYMKLYQRWWRFVSGKSGK